MERGFPFHIQLSQRQPRRHQDHIMTCFIHKKFAQAKPLALFLYYHNNKSPLIIFEPRHTTIRSGGLNSFNFEDNKSASYRTTDQLISIVGEPHILTGTSTTHQYQRQQPPQRHIRFLGQKPIQWGTLDELGLHEGWTQTSRVRNGFLWMFFDN
jgi:hypothetical protein